MATVIGVRFKKAGKVYYFDPGELWPRPGQNAVVETARGIEFGEIVTAPRSVSDEQIVAPLKKVVRIATEEDEQRAAFNEKRETEAFAICQEKIARHKLEMKLVSVECTFDNSKIIFYFTANGRVDFRELVKDLAGVFKMRIELRQIGVRDEAKMLGGLGACGRPICCGAFLGDFQPVSIKMAKEQNLSLNPTKISGQCGRLMCCLKYEQDTYEQTLRRVPKVGKDIVTPDGTGVITEINAIRERVKVRIRVGDDDSFEVREYSMDDVRRPGPDDPPAIRETPKPQERRPSPKKAQSSEEENAEELEALEEEENKRRRYPRPKIQKTQSTEQYFENMQAGSPAVEDAPEAGEEETGAKDPEPAAREHKRSRHRGGRGHRGEGAEDAQAESGEKPRREQGPRERKSRREGEKRGEQPRREGEKHPEQPAHEGEKRSEQPTHDGEKRSEQPAREGEKRSEQSAHEGEKRSEQSAHEGEKRSEQPAHEGEKRSEQPAHEAQQPARET